MLAACPFPANHGTPGSIREMAEAVAERGHDVHLVTYHFGEAIPVRGPHLHRISPWTRETTVRVGPTVWRPLYDLQMVFKTLEVVRHHRPNLLHAHGYEATLAAWLCRLRTGLPLLYSGHNTMTDELPSYRFLRPQGLAVALARLLDAVVPRLADRCLPHSTNIDRFFRQQGLRGQVEPVINFGIDLAWMAQGEGAKVRQDYGLGASRVILYTGVLDEFQRLDLLLEAVAQIAPCEPAVKLLIVSTIPHAGHQARLRQQAAQLGIADRVVVTDPVPLDSVRDFLQVGDVAVVPRPAAPGFPIKLLNYLAAGKACVLFASSASTGLVDGENVLLASPDTREALAQALLRVLRDDDLRQRLAGQGREFVHSQHDRSRVAQQVCAAYVRTLARAGHLPRLYRRPVPIHPGNGSPQHRPSAQAGVVPKAVTE
jgi:1,2-diacylglycerol 3-alpha-glucosyltransferase